MKLSRDQIVGALIVILGVFVFVMISSFNIKQQEFPHPLRWRDELPCYLLSGREKHKKTDWDSQ